jgi:hypothetical protein
MGDWRVPAILYKRFEPAPRARMLAPEVFDPVNRSSCLK